MVPLLRAILLLYCSAEIAAMPSTPSPSDVLVVANIHSAESLELANYYLQKRQIPSENLILVKTTTEGAISRPRFIEEVLHPIRDQLLEKGFVEARMDTSIRDAQGRFHFQPFATHFKYLVLCKGVPLKILEHPHPSEQDLPPDMPAAFRKTQASVDSELALLTAENQRYTGPIANPLFRIASPSRLDYSSVIAVTRLDGPTLQHAKRIIRDSIAAETKPFVSGRAYIDLNNHHPDGNLWLREAATYLRIYGYEVDVIPASRHWSFSDRHDAPAIYLGWYQTHASGPMLWPQNVPLGAIAAHIHSYSAGTVHSLQHQWVGPLIHAGFTVTFGNVFEPYLQLTLRPDHFIELLLRGYCVGDASLYGQPFVSWQHVTIADPLYQPFKPAAKWDPIEVLENPQSDPYERIIALSRIASKNPVEAAESAMQSHIQSPNLTVAFKILWAFPNVTSPVLIDRIKDYLASQHDITSIEAPLYLRYHQELITVGENQRSQQILRLMETNQRQWHPELQQAVQKLSDSSDSVSTVDPPPEP